MAVSEEPAAPLILTCLRRQPKQQRSRDRVNQILDAASSLLATAGPNGTTITAVAEQTGLATSSIYAYVEGDRELIGAVAERGLEAIHEGFVEFVGNPTTIAELRESLTAGLHAFLQLYESDLGLRAAMAFIDADPELRYINVNDTRRSTQVVLQAIAPLRPDVDLSHAAMLLVHLSGALANFAVLLDSDEAAGIVAEFERLIELSLT